MGYSIKWSLSAEQDLDLIYNYYSCFSKISAMRIVSDILQSVEVLKIFPKSGALNKELREGIRVLVANDRYSIVYECISDLVYIHAIWSQYQNPKTLQSRFYK